MIAGILLGLALKVVTCISVADGEQRNPWLNYLTTCQIDAVVVSFQLTVLIGYYCFTIGLGAKRGSQTIYLHWSRFQSWLCFSAGLDLGVFMSMLLSVASWGLQGGLSTPKAVFVLLVSVLGLTSFWACTAAYFQAVTIIWNPEEEKDDVVEDEKTILHCQG